VRKSLPLQGIATIRDRSCNKYIERQCDVKRLLVLFFEWLEQNSQPSVVPCSLEARNLTVDDVHGTRLERFVFYTETDPKHLCSNSMQVADNPFTAFHAIRTMDSAVPGIGNTLATHGPEPSHPCRDHSRRHEGQFIEGHHERFLDCESVVRRGTHTVPRVDHDAIAQSWQAT
jgi:hypothetical protein